MCTSGPRPVRPPPSSGGTRLVRRAVRCGYVQSEVISAGRVPVPPSWARGRTSLGCSRTGEDVSAAVRFDMQDTAMP